MRVLFVDDDVVVAQSVEMALRQKGHDCEIADLGERALSLAKRHDYDIIVLDVGLPDVDGDQIARRMKMEGVETPLLLQSGFDDPSLAAEAKSLGADDFLAKPFNIADLIERMEIILGLPRSAAAPEPKARQSANRDKGTPETEAPREEPAADAAPPLQDDPPERPSAVAQARAALLAQPPQPTRLKAASEVMAGGSAKALSKARAALAAQRGGRTTDPVPPESEAAHDPDTADEPQAAGGAKAFAEPVARVRAAFGDKLLSKATGKARAALLDKFPSRPKADDEPDGAPGDGDLEAGAESGAGGAGKAGLGLAARARAALDANPLTQTVAKTRTALKERRGARSAVDPETESAPEVELPPQLEPEFWAEPETRAEIQAEPETHAEPPAQAATEESLEAVDAGTPADAPAPDPELLPEAESMAPSSQEASSELTPGVLDQPAVEPELATGREASCEHKPCGPVLEPEPPAQAVAESEPGESENSSESLSDGDVADGAPVPNPEPQPGPEAAPTEESSTAPVEHDGQEITPEFAPNAVSQPASLQEMAAGGEPATDHEPCGPDLEPEPPAQAELDPEEADNSSEALSDGGPTDGAPMPDPGPQPWPEAVPATESSAATEEHDGPEISPDIAPSGPEPQALESEPEIENQPWIPDEADDSQGSEPDVGAAAAPSAEASDPEPQPQPEPGSVEQPSPETAEPDGQETSSHIVSSGPDVLGEPQPEPNPEAGLNPEAEPAAAGEEPATVETGEGAKRRRHERKEMVEAGVIDIGDGTIPCVIMDLSESGARLLLLDAAQACPLRFVLVPMEGPRRHCVRRWRDGDKIGIEFEEPAADDDQESLPEAEGEESK